MYLKLQVFCTYINDTVYDHVNMLPKCFVVYGIYVLQNDKRETWLNIRISVTLTGLIFSCRCVEESWPTFYPGVETSDDLSIGYTTSFYWIATTLSQTGYGDIRPYLTLEYVLAIFLMSVAFIVFNLCVISITAMLLNSSYSKLVGIIISNMIYIMDLRVYAL